MRARILAAFFLASSFRGEEQQESYFLDEHFLKSSRDELYGPGVTAWSCSGTPADCVKLALSELLAEKPDLVLSGVNHGPNLGTDVFCSGTVAAAMEGTLEGLPALAVSVACFQWRVFQAAAELAMDVAEKALTDH